MLLCHIKHCYAFKKEIVKDRKIIDVKRNKQYLLKFQLTDESPQISSPNLLFEPERKKNRYDYFTLELIPIWLCILNCKYPKFLMNQTEFFMETTSIVTG